MKVKGEMTLKSKAPDARVAQSSELVETIVYGDSDPTSVRLLTR